MKETSMLDVNDNYSLLLLDWQGADAQSLLMPSLSISKVWASINLLIRVGLQYRSRQAESHISRLLLKMFITFN